MNKETLKILLVVCGIASITTIAIIIILVLMINPHATNEYCQTCSNISKNLHTPLFSVNLKAFLAIHVAEMMLVMAQQIINQLFNSIIFIKPLHPKILNQSLE